MLKEHKILRNLLYLRSVAHSRRNHFAVECSFPQLSLVKNCYTEDIEIFNGMKMHLADW